MQGTGKTSTIVQMLHSLAASDKTVLVCAPSNAAVENVLSKWVTDIPNRFNPERTKEITDKILRIGIEKIPENLKMFTLVYLQRLTRLGCSGSTEKTGRN